MRFLTYSLALFLCGLAAADDKDDALRRMEAKAPHYGEMSRKIWEFAELGYKETRSSALLREELRGAGFRIDEGVAGMRTAFVASRAPAAGHRPHG